MQGPPAVRSPRARTKARGWEKEIGSSGGSLEPTGPLLTHLDTVYMEYFECLPTRLRPLAERTCFSQARASGKSNTTGPWSVRSARAHSLRAKLRCGSPTLRARQNARILLCASRWIMRKPGGRASLSALRRGVGIRACSSWRGRGRWGSCGRRTVRVRSSLYR